MRAPRSNYPQCWVYAGCELTMNLSLKRIGAGAFGYDFGALDDVDNPLTESYMNVVCDHPPPTPAVRVPSRANPPPYFLVLRPSEIPPDYSFS